MKRHTGTLLVSALVVAVTAIGSVPASASQEVEVPFRATLNGTSSFECDFSGLPNPAVPCDFEVETVLIGTHLGRSTMTSTGITTIYLDQPCTTPDDTVGVQFHSLTDVVVVAANGDELYAVNDVEGCGDGIGVSEPFGTYTITGGTGRFAGASGTGDVSTTTSGGTPDPGPFASSWTGTITY